MCYTVEIALSCVTYFNSLVARRKLFGNRDIASVAALYGAWQLNEQLQLKTYHCMFIYIYNIYKMDALVTPITIKCGLLFLN